MPLSGSFAEMPAPHHRPPLRPQVLYLGAASGTSVSHVSDVVGPEGSVYAVEFSHRRWAAGACAGLPGRRVGRRTCYWRAVVWSRGCRHPASLPPYPCSQHPNSSVCTLSTRSGRDLVNMAKKRPNVIPIIEDARHPQKYRMLVPMVSVGGSWRGSCAIPLAPACLPACMHVLARCSGCGAMAAAACSWFCGHMPCARPPAQRNCMAAC